MPAVKHVSERYIIVIDETEKCQYVCFEIRKWFNEFIVIIILIKMEKAIILISNLINVFNIKMEIFCGQQSA